jgi:hypothetical protein
VYHAVPALYQKNVSALGLSVSQTQAKHRVHDVSELLSEVRTALGTQGVRGIVSMQRRFKLMDEDNNGTVSFAEFKKGIKDCGVFLTEEV